MQKESNREDLDHKPENAAKVGEKHKQMNQEGEQDRRPATPTEDGHEDRDTPQ